MVIVSWLMIYILDGITRTTILLFGMLNFIHSSEIKIFMLDELMMQRKMLQNLPYLYKYNSKVALSIFHYFSTLMNARSMSTYTMTFIREIRMAKFEAFHWVISSVLNHLFLKSAIYQPDLLKIFELFFPTLWWVY